jgi:hypothetical protein
MKKSTVHQGTGFYAKKHQQLFTDDIGGFRDTERPPGQAAISPSMEPELHRLPALKKANRAHRRLKR